MGIKNFLSIIICTFFVINGFTQNITDEGNQWNILTVGMQGSTISHSIKIDGDTTLDNVTYKKVFYSSDSLNTSWQLIPQFIREEPNTKKVFLKEFNQEEVLMYDFNLEVGDTFNIEDLWGNYDCQIVVFQIDSVSLLNGEKRKRLHLHDMYHPDSYIDRWIEGIGSMYGVNTDPFRAYCSTDYPYYLLCHYNNEELLLQAHPTSCFITPIQEISKSDPIKVFPNPSQGKLRIEIGENNHLIKELKIFSSLGDLIIQDNSDFAGNKEIDISHLPKGIYFLIISISSEQIYSQKIIKY